MNKKYICVHGHFYQPPRENPWLNKVEIQDSAYPYHDWNHRINAECYARNASSRILNTDGKISEIMNNYAWLSFNMGPTLLEWMELETPETYRKILEADKESQERFSGHGSAIAQVYNHLIMPLANQRDQETQVIWGIADFKSRFERMPEGMWLAETAVDTSSLEMLAKHGIKYTILSPYQAKNFRKIGDEQWQDALDAKIDTRRAYVCNLPSGKQINLFFYDGDSSQAVAFEGLLDNGDTFAKKLLGQFHEQDEVQLVNIATDGESYGHHHHLGEMALSYCLNDIAKSEEAELTIYGEFLEKFPPEYEVEILEDSSWSCVHGVERWKSDCGCNTGGHPDWNQQWRAPLREAFDWVRDQLTGLYENQMKEYTDDPWEIRNKYIEVILNRDSENIDRFLKENFKKELQEEDKVKLLRLLEMQYHCLLMYTSCGWFFDEVTGIESMQDVFYATRAVQLAEEVNGANYSDEFEAHLEKIPSNLSEFENALVAYKKFVKPMELDIIRIAAHYAISSLFEEFPDEVNLYNFSATVISEKYFEAGKQKLLIGRANIQSDVTREQKDVSYAVLHLGEQHLYGGVRGYMGADALEELTETIAELFNRGKTYEIFNHMDHFFGSHNYSFWHLFRDEQRHIMRLVMKNTLESAEGAVQQVYENAYPLLQTVHEINMRVPLRLQLPVQLAVNTKLSRALKKKNFKLKEFQNLLNSAELIQVNLDVVTLNFLADNCLNRLMKEFWESPKNVELLENINQFLDVLHSSPLRPNKWEAQNIIFAIRGEHFPEDQGEAPANWKVEFARLSVNLNLEL